MEAWASLMMPINPWAACLPRPNRPFGLSSIQEKYNRSQSKRLHLFCSADNPQHRVIGEGVRAEPYNSRSYGVPRRDKRRTLAFLPHVPEVARGAAQRHLARRAADASQTVPRMRQAHARRHRFRTNLRISASDKNPEQPP